MEMRRDLLMSRWPHQLTCLAHSTFVDLVDVTSSHQKFSALSHALGRLRLR